MLYCSSHKWHFKYSRVLTLINLTQCFVIASNLDYQTRYNEGQKKPIRRISATPFHSHPSLHSNWNAAKAQRYFCVQYECRLTFHVPGVTAHQLGFYGGFARKVRRLSNFRDRLALPQALFRIHSALRQCHLRLFSELTPHLWRYQILEKA